MAFCPKGSISKSMQSLQFFVAHYKRSNHKKQDTNHDFVVLRVFTFEVVIHWIVGVAFELCTTLHIEPKRIVQSSRPLSS